MVAWTAAGPSSFVNPQAVAASSKRYGMLFHAGGAVVRAMGIGAVFTRPDARGKGAAPALLQAMTDAGPERTQARLEEYEQISEQHQFFLRE